MTQDRDKSIVRDDAAIERLLRQHAGAARRTPDPNLQHRILCAIQSQQHRDIPNLAPIPIARWHSRAVGLAAAIAMLIGTVIIGMLLMETTTGTDTPDSSHAGPATQPAPGPMALVSSWPRAGADFAATMRETFTLEIETTFEQSIEGTRKVVAMLPFQGRLESERRDFPASP